MAAHFGLQRSKKYSAITNLIADHGYRTRRHHSSGIIGLSRMLNRGANTLRLGDIAGGCCVRAGTPSAHDHNAGVVEPSP